MWTMLISAFCVIALGAFLGVNSLPVNECLLTRRDLVKGLGDHILNLVKLQSTGSINNRTKASDCSDLLKLGYTTSDVYEIYLIDPTTNRANPVKVYCDMVTDGGGWTVIQRRIDGAVDFYRGWADYKQGFGNVHGEYWLGNDNINRLTRRKTYKLRVDVEEATGAKIYAVYSMFAIASERHKYKLSLGTYSGNAGDSLTYHAGMAFSTKDRDNDPHSSHCAQAYKGGWWYNGCHYANLNGQYLLGPDQSDASGVEWYHGGKGHKYSYKSASMMLRPGDF